MGWIKDRILAEYKKHERLGKEDWSKLAEVKIYNQIKDILYEEVRMERFAYGQGCKKACDEMKNDILCRLHSSNNDKLRSYDDIFINHIKRHLKEGEVVICKICGKSAEEIIDDANVGKGDK